MVTVQTLLNGSNGDCIQTPLTVEVLLLEAFSQVPGAVRCRCRCVLADSTGVVRGFCYKPPQFGEGDTVTLYNYNVEDGRIVLHQYSASDVGFCGMNIPPVFRQEAMEMMNTPVRAPINISDIKTVSPTDKVTFSGQIVQIDGPMIKQTEHSGPRSLLELVCRDHTGSVYLGLWEYCSQLHFTLGQRVLVKDARTRDNNYHHQITVSINHPDEIEVLP